MTNGGHRRLEYALILTGILLVAAVAGYATNKLDGLRVTGSVTITDDLTVADDATITGDATVGLTFGVSGESTFADSVYIADSVYATGTVKGAGLRLIYKAGAVDSTDFMAGYIFARGDSVFMLGDSKGSWVQLAP